MIGGSVALGLLLGSAVLHSLWNLLVKGGSGSSSGEGLVFLWVYSTLSSLAAIAYLIWTCTGIGVPCLVSALVHTGYVVCLQLAYRSGALSVVLPIVRGGAPALLCLGAVLAGGHVGVPVIIGTGLVIVGIVVTARSGGSLGRVGSALFWAIGAAVLSAGYTAWDAYSVTSLQVGPLDFLAGATICQWVLVSVPLVLVWIRGSSFPLWRTGIAPRRLGSAGAVAVLAPASSGLTIFAMTIASAEIVAVGKTLTVLCAGVAGALFFRERPAWGGLLLIAAGVAAASF